MASFKQRYDELFGESPPYDPIELSDRTASRATSIQEGAPTASPKRALPLYEPDYGVKKGGDSGVLGNVGRELGAGVMDVADMALGAAGYAADFFVPEQVDDFVMDTIYSGRQGIREVTESIRSGISEDAKQKAASELLTLDPNRTIWSGNPLDVAEAILYKTARALPATVATLAPPIAFAKAGATAKAITYMGASEGTLSMGGIANGIQDEIMAIPTEQLLQESPRFAEILESNGGDADAARNDLIREARGFAPLVGGATVAAISSAAGRYFTPIFEKGTEAAGASLGRRVGTGFAAEFPQEASQGASEQFVQNYSAKIYDLDRQLSEGVAEAAAQEGLIGGIMGGGAGGIFGQRPAAPPPPPGPPIDPNARPELTEQPDLPGIEPGGPDGTLPDAMDQPTPEPSGDIQAQLNDMWDDNNPRRAVFVPPGQNYDYLQVPPGVEDYIFEDGSALIAKDPAVIEEALARLDAGESKQAVVGSLIGVGEGKPTNPASRVVQLLDKQGNVTRESVVATQAEAEALGVTWSKEKENKDRRVTIMSPREALERRQALGQENTIPIQEDLFDNTAARGTEGVVVPAEPGPPGQLDLPLTLGRERGRGRVPLPPREIEEQQNEDLPYDVALPANQRQDPYEVSRRQDDAFAGPSTFEPSIEDEVREDIRKDIPFEERAEPLAAVEGVRSYGQAADRLIGEAAAAREADERTRIGGFYNPDTLTFENPEYETAYRDAWNDALDAELTVEMSNQKRAKERAKKKRQAALVEMGKVRQIAKPKRKTGKAETMVKAAKTVNPAEVRAIKNARAQENEPEPGPRPPGTLTQQRETETDYLGEFQGGTREQLDSLAKYTVRHKTPSAKEWKSEEFDNGPAAYARRDEIKKRYPKRSVTVDVEGTRALDEEFERAVTYREGREADTRTEPDAVEVKEQDDTPEELTGDLKFTKEEKANRPDLNEVEYTTQIDRSQYKTPGAKLKFIRREAEHKRRKDTGQRSIKATPVRRSAAPSTAEPKKGESEQEFNKRVGRTEKGKKFDTQPLTVENYKLDESVSDRVKRQERAKQARTSVGKAATQARTFLRKLKAPENANEKTRSNFLYAKNYLQQLIQFARSIQAAKNESDANIKLAEGVAKMLAAAPGLDVEAFANKWGAIARANEFDDLSNLKFTSLAELRKPGKRTEATNKTNREIMTRKENREFMDSMKDNQLFTAMIGPVLQKMSSYVLDNAEGIPTQPYIPNELEMAEIIYAMQTFKNNWNANRIPSITKGRVAKTLGKPDTTGVYNKLRKQMERLGFQFNKSGNITGFEGTEEYMGARERSMFKGQQEKGGAEIERGAAQTLAKQKPAEDAPKVTPRNDSTLRPQVVKEEQSVEEAVAALDARKAKKKVKEQEYEVEPGLLQIDAVNGLIDRLNKATTAKTTISGIKRAEQRFIRGLRQLGAWRDTAPGIGTIVLPNKTKTYRLVGPRLDKKAIKAGQAKDALRRLAKFAIPKNMLADVKRARADTETRAGLDKFLDDAALDLFNDAAGPIKYDAEYIGVANRVNELMTDGKITGQDVVNAIMEIAPQNSFYRNLATRLISNDIGNVEVTFGTQEDFPDGQLGKYSRANNRIILNRDALNMSDLTADSAYGARVVHTLTHELVHAQTHAAIDNSPLLRRRMEELQTRAREMWQSRVGGKMPYGLKVLEKSQNEAHEFVAEAFSNHEFQQFLKETPAAPQTLGDLWTSFVEAVRNILGLPPREVGNSLFDAIMMQENILFDDAGIGGVAQGDLYMTGEAVIDNVSSLVHDAVQKSFPVWDKIKNASRNLMTFEQLHDTYTKYFDDAEGGNPFTRYMDAWKRRNAAVSKNMKLPEKLSVKWTMLEATDPDAALELSRIGTEATIERLTPSKELTAEERSEVADVRLKKYDELRARYKALPEPARTLYNELREYYKGAAQEEAKLLLSASLRGVLTKGPNAVMTQAEYKARFTEATLNEMKDVDSITAELKDLVPEEQIQGLVKELQRMSSLRQLGFGDYFPLMRYGEYTVYKAIQRPDKVYDDKGEAFGERRRLLQEDPTLDVDVIDKGDKAVLRVMEKEFWMFESKTEAQKKAAEIGSTVEARLSTESGGTAITSNAGLNTILTSLKDNPAAQGAIKEHYLRSLSDQAFRKHELKRKNRVGVNYDIQHRNLANYMKQSSHYRAQLQYGWQMGEAIQDMRKYTHGRPDGGGITTEQLQQVYKQVKMRDEMVNDNTQLMKWVREGVNVTQFMMLTSPSYWMINSSQPWLVTAPIMGGRYGMGNSYSALKDAMRLVKGPLWSQVKASRAGLKAFTDPVATEDAFNVVDQVLESIKQSGDPRADDIVELIDDLRDQNIIDINVLTELRQIAEGTQGTAWTNTLDASRILAHITEVSNRTITAIAAYNLVMNDGGTKEQAKQYAADMVSQTQFNYSSENKPPLFQPGGPLKWAAPLMFQFMQWPQHMYALLIRNVAASVKGGTAEERAKARKSVLGLLGTHAAVGGMVGMALQPIKWAFGMAMFAFGDDDEPYTFAQAINGRTFDNLVAEALTELFGAKAGRAVSHGLPTLLGTDLSARMSMGTLYFVDLRGDTAEGVLGSLAASFGGATLNQMMNWGNALGKVGQGDVMRGVEQASPKILRDAIRSVRYYNDGLVNNAGDTVIDAKDMSFAEVFLQSIGFSPDEVSQFYSSQAAIKGAQGYARDRRDALVRGFVNDGMTAEVMREVMEFNRAYPSLRITRSSLIRGARSQVERESRYRRYGANIDEKQARDFADYGESYRD